jgi:hypothetical protein
MKTIILTMSSLLIVALILKVLSNYLIGRVFSDADKLIEEEQSSKREFAQYTSPNVEYMPPHIEEPKEENPIILEVKNDSSTRNPKAYNVDYNDVQNLTKYNKNTYRATNGRFKSLKA